MLGFLIYKISQFLASILPLKVSYEIAEVIAYIYYLLARNSRRVILYNLRRGLEEKYSDVKIRYIARQIFKNFGKGVVDFCKFSKINKNFVEDDVDINNLEYIDEVLGNKGVIALTGHIGNYELGGVVLSILGYPVNVVAMPHRRKKVENFFLKQRHIKGINVIPVGFAFRECYRRLLSKEVLALLSDRKYSRSGIAVECFNKKVLVPKGPAVLSLKTNSAIVSGYMIRKNHHFELTFERPIYPENIEGDSFQERVRKLAQQYITTMEKYIEKYPEQWILFHKLFIDKR